MGLTSFLFPPIFSLLIYKADISLSRKKKAPTDKQLKFGQELHSIFILQPTHVLAGMFLDKGLPVLEKISKLVGSSSCCLDFQEKRSDFVLIMRQLTCYRCRASPARLCALHYLRTPILKFHKPDEASCTGHAERLLMAYPGADWKHQKRLC